LSVVRVREISREEFVINIGRLKRRLNQEVVKRIALPSIDAEVSLIGLRLMHGNDRADCPVLQKILYQRESCPSSKRE
jgi:hypothetical protein